MTIIYERMDSSGTICPLEGHEYRKSRCTLNVGGLKREVLWSSLISFAERHPHTRLGRLMLSSNPSEHCDEYSPNEAEFFFDQPPRSFNAILDFYQTGKLHLTADICPIAFAQDLEYWEIDETSLDFCCLEKFQNMKSLVAAEMLYVGEIEEADFENRACGSYRSAIWFTFEHPSSSWAGRVISSISIFLIALSTIGVVLGTIPWFQNCSYAATNSTICKKYPNHGWFQSDDDAALPIGLSHDFIWVQSKWLVLIEQICVIAFTIEYLVRFAVSPGKWAFLKGGLNNIDLMAILPFYIILLIQAETTKSRRTEQIRKMLQVFRILRILKLARHSTGLRSLGFTFRSAYKELGVLVLFLGMGILMFSTLVFFAEADSNSEFSSIPAGFWWAVVTMTTVGYGDVTPTTLPGKLVGSLCAVSGVLVIALPIPIIVSKFTEFYRIQVKIDKQRKQNAASKSSLTRKNSSKMKMENSPVRKNKRRTFSFVRETPRRVQDYADYI